MPRGKLVIMEINPLPLLVDNNVHPLVTSRLFSTWNTWTIL